MTKQEVEKTIAKLKADKEKLNMKRASKVKEYDDKLNQLKDKLLEEKASKLVPIDNEIKIKDSEIAKYEKVKLTFEKQEAEIAKLLGE